MDGRDFVFLHGGGQGGWIWNETVAALEAQGGAGSARFLVLDAPGCGSKRDRPTDGMAMREVAAELIGDVERAGFERIVLVGHSQAGQALPIIAQARPDLVSRLIYVSCAAPLPGQTVPQMMGRGLHNDNPEEVGWPPAPADATAAERFQAMFCNDMAPAQAAAFVAALGRDAWPPATYEDSDWRYDDIGGVPSTYILCLRDLALPPPWQERFAERLRVDETIRIDAGHQVMNTRPHALAEAIRLASYGGSGR